MSAPYLLLAVVVTMSAFFVTLTMASAVLAGLADRLTRAVQHRFVHVLAGEAALPCGADRVLTRVFWAAQPPPPSSVARRTLRRL